MHFFFPQIIMLFYCFNKRALVIFCSMCPHERSQKLFSPLLKLCLLNLNIILMLIIFKCKIRIKFFSHFDSLGASFTKQGKLARERNSKTAPMGVDISAGDLLTMRKLNTDTTSFYISINTIYQAQCKLA